jgi:putative restriction endonuclease
MCVTGERTLPVLTAAHIKLFAENGPHDVRNGLLLRSDLHTLFDLGYLTITPDYHLKVSEQIREEYENGREYYGFQDRKISLPADERKRPSREYLDWHNQAIFKP